MAEKKLALYSREEYLVLEEKALHKNEFDHGRIVGMSGGTINHGIIGNNINSALSNAVKSSSQPCIPINGDVRIFIENADSFVYPDGMLVCGEIETYKSDNLAVINPILIVEVLSNSTEKYDRGDKFHKYCSLPSFKEYVLIDQFKPVIDVLYRKEVSSWNMVTTIGLEKSIYIHTLDCHIKMADIYENSQNLGAPQFQIDF